MDIICPVDSWPENDQKYETESFLYQGGGPVATALVALQRLGVQTSFIGRVGDDSTGESIRKGLEQESIDCSSLKTIAGTTSPTAFIIANSSNGHRTILWNKGTSFPISPDEVTEKSLVGADLLHLDGLHIEASIRAAEIAQKIGVPVMLDTGTWREQTVQLFKLVDYLIVGEPLAKTISSDMGMALFELAKHGSKLVGITLGDRGSVFLKNNKPVYFPAFKVKAVDTTGCGDTFHAGMIYGILQNWPLSDQVRFASAVAAMKSTKLGGRTALPRMSEVVRFLAQNSFR